MPLLTIASALWGNPWSRLIAVAILAFGFGWVKGFGAVPRVDVAAVTRNAEAGRDAEWTRKLAQLERESQDALAAAIAARDATDPADADVGRLCDADAACRDKSR